MENKSFEISVLIFADMFLSKINVFKRKKNFYIKVTMFPCNFCDIQRILKNILHLVKISIIIVNISSKFSLSFIVEVIQLVLSHSF